MKKLHKGFYSHKGFTVATNGKIWRGLKGRVEIFGATKREVYLKIEAA